MPPYIAVKTPIPGPRSLALAERRARAVAGGVATTHPIFLAAGHDVTVTDVDGNTYLDFTSGIGVLNVGHTHPEVVSAIAEQAGRLTHACFQVAGYEGYVAVCEALCRIAPLAADKRAVLFCSGAEAVENAVKIARRHTGRPAVLCFEHAFHGRTLLGLSLTGKVAPYKLGFGPFLPEVYRLPYPYPYRNQGPQAPLSEQLQTLVAPSELAAVIIEPILGEGGFVVPPAAFLSELRALCDEYGIVLIADEIQSGFGRTGTMFACENHGLSPDLLTLAKSVAGGLPLSAVVGRAAIMDAVPKGGLGGTYAGNPVACAAALKAIEVLCQLVASGRPAAIGESVRERLLALKSSVALIGEVRGLGPMLAVELVRNRRTRQPATEETAAAVAAARQRGVLLLSAGTYGNVIRFLFPLTISDAALDEGLAVVEEVLRELYR
jgi:4-aminobutyrate aminotransferase/(S)-3-amino-2-methylpropionate transaminase